MFEQKYILNKIEQWAERLPCNLFRRWTMFRIIKAGAGIGLTENLNYIKKAENGCYILCPEHDALSPWRKPGALTLPRRLNTLISSLNGLSLWPTR